MNSIARKQLYNRKRLVRRLLALELRLSKYYEKELSDEKKIMTDEERVYKRHVVEAAEKARHYAGNLPNAEVRIKYFDMLTDGYSNKRAICTEVNICDSTYHEWMKPIIRIFGKAMGIFI